MIKRAKLTKSDDHLAVGAEAVLAPACTVAHEETVPGTGRGPGGRIAVTLVSCFGVS